MNKHKRVVLISGSRDVSAELLTRVRGGVGRIFWKQDELIVGDARGVDAYVVQLAEAMKLPYMAYGIFEQGRNDASHYTNLRRLMRWKHHKTYTLYRMRDEYMVERASVVLCFWNGKSNGTKHVFDFACRMGKDAYLIGGDGLIETNAHLLDMSKKSGRPQIRLFNWEQIRT